MTDLNARFRIAKRIHDLLLHELGEDIDVGLLLGRIEYARAVLSLCRGSGSAELAGLAEEFSLQPVAKPAGLPAGSTPPAPATHASAHG